jgi:hypothetical protein
MSDKCFLFIPSTRRFTRLERGLSGVSPSIIVVREMRIHGRRMTIFRQLRSFGSAFPTSERTFPIKLISRYNKELPHHGSTSPLRHTGKSQIVGNRKGKFLARSPPQLL